MTDAKELQMKLEAIQSTHQSCILCPARRLATLGALGLFSEIVQRPSSMVPGERLDD